MPALRVALAIFTLILQPKALKEPKVTHVNSDGVHTIGNPFTRPVVIELDCGPDWERLPLTMKAREITMVKIVMPGVNYAPRCFVSSYNFITEKK